jgi:hypothetical protein
MHSNDSTAYLVQLVPFFRLVCCQRVLMLYWINLATNYEIVLHLLLPEVEIRLVELPQTHLGWVGCWIHLSGRLVRSFARSGYNCRWVRLHYNVPECNLTELGTSTTALSKVSTNRVVDVRFEIGLLCLECGRTSCTDSFDADFGQTTSTRSEYKPMALPEVCTKHYQREYDSRNRYLIVHCTD